MRITSRDNSLLRQARAVRDGKTKDLIFVEGLRLCEEAFRSKLAIEAIIYSDHLAEKERAADAIEQLAGVAERAATVSEKLLESISYTKTPQGIVALAKRPESDETVLSTLPDHPLLVVMHQINNPVNVGAIIRTAEAAGAAGAIATLNTSDPFSPKALRGAMGSGFRLPMWVGPSYASVINWCQKRKIETVCADVDSEVSFTGIDWKEALALIVGPESTGLSPVEIESADNCVRIPMKGAVESLNVSVATGILLFEAARQRQK